MGARTKTIREINERLRSGNAVVMSAMEFKSEVRSGYRFKVSDVDVVTTATRAVMSGTSALLTVPIEGKDEDESARELFLNGVPCHVGLKPADSSGLVDAVVHGTDESRDHFGRYGGGHLLRDLVENKTIDVECTTDCGRVLYSVLTLADLRFARLYSFRNDYQNYMAFTNAKNRESYRSYPQSIFSCRPMPKLKGLSASGSGELNPLENDPRGRIFRAGTKILVNKVPGVVIGYGTRSSAKTRNLSVAADLSGMDPEFMGGFKTGFGVEVTNSIAVPFPVLDQGVLDDLSECLDENIRLPVADLSDRVPLADLTYADIWEGAKLEVDFDPSRCIFCSCQCPAEYYCPMGAISWKDKRIDQSLCFACGACASNCPGGAFHGIGDRPRGRIGDVHVLDETVPVVFRQSNRYRSELLADHLKELLRAGEFLLSDSQLELTTWSR